MCLCLDFDWPGQGGPPRSLVPTLRSLCNPSVMHGCSGVGEVVVLVILFVCIYQAVFYIWFGEVFFTCVGRCFFYMRWAMFFLHAVADFFLHVLGDILDINVGDIHKNR